MLTEPTHVSHDHDATKGDDFDTIVMFCPHQPARILRISENAIHVRLPRQARSGPVAIVRRDRSALAEVSYLLKRYACEYPEWRFSVFAYVPMARWAYPTAFAAPQVAVMELPSKVVVHAFTAKGRLTPDQIIQLHEPVTVHYEVFPPGSEHQTPLSFDAPGGNVTRRGAGLLVYRATKVGLFPLELTWGSLTHKLKLHAKGGS